MSRAVPLPGINFARSARPPEWYARGLAAMEDFITQVHKGAHTPTDDAEFHAWNAGAVNACDELADILMEHLGDPDGSAWGYAYFEFLAVIGRLATVQR